MPRSSKARSPFSIHTEADALAWAQQVRRETIRRTEKRLAYFRLMALTYTSYREQAERLERELKWLKAWRTE